MNSSNLLIGLAVVIAAGVGGMLLLSERPSLRPDFDKEDNKVVEVTFQEAESDEPKPEVRAYAEDSGYVTHVTYVSAEEQMKAFIEAHKDDRPVIDALLETGEVPFGHQLLFHTNDSESAAALYTKLTDRFGSSPYVLSIIVRTDE